MRHRKWLGIALFVGLAALFTVVRPTSARPKTATKKAKPRVEVVFCLDTTGSMGGLIDGAKQKIWSLCNQIAGGKSRQKNATCSWPSNGEMVFIVPLY